MPLTVYQASTVTAKPTGGGGGIGGGNGGQGGGGGGIRTGGGGGSRPTVNMPTSRPTFNQPTARPTFSFTQPPAFSSISFSRTVPSFTGSFTRTVVTATSYTFNPTFTIATSTAYYPPYGGWGFIQYPPNYNPSVGSFTLTQTLAGQNGVPCLYYSAFQFDASAGQQFQARIWTTGQSISYVIVPASLLTALQQANTCGYGLGQSQAFSSQISLNWTAPQTGQYAIIFYSATPYSGPVYFVAGAQ